MRRRKRLPSQLATDLGISHATATRWLSGEDIPNTKSCQKLAAYSGTPLEMILSLAGHMPEIARAEPTEWPEFREYARRKYRKELDVKRVGMSHCTGLKASTMMTHELGDRFFFNMACSRVEM